MYYAIYYYYPNLEVGDKRMGDEVGDWVEGYYNSPHEQFSEAKFTLLWGLH